MKKLLYEISHTTTYSYADDVSVSQHLLRLAPRHDGKQLCLSHELEINPQAGTMATHHDYFGNPVTFIGLEKPHRELVIKSRSRVAVGLSFTPEPMETPSWELVRNRCRQDYARRSLEAHEFTYPSPLLPEAEEFA